MRAEIVREVSDDYHRYGLTRLFNDIGRRSREGYYSSIWLDSLSKGQIGELRRLGYNVSERSGNGEGTYVVCWKDRNWCRDWWGVIYRRLKV